MKRKCLAVGIILLFIGTAIIPSSGQTIEKSSTTISRGNWLYVGGSGPGNYTTIQSAIDAANTGDTVFVYNGTYYVNVMINKTINLLGEKKETTIIDGGGINNTIYVNACWTKITNFTIKNGHWAVVFYDFYSNNNTIMDNIISEGDAGIVFQDCTMNNIFNNIIENNTWNGIFFVNNEGEWGNRIIGNTIRNNYNGINTYDLSSLHPNFYYHNNFIQNTRHVVYYYQGDVDVWNDSYPSGGNYWDNYSGADNYHGPNQNILGADGIGDTPYNISGGSNQDLYPFMKPNGWLNEPPVANFTYTVRELSVTFNASSSYDPDGNITTWSWDFGDGADGAGLFVIHNYSASGTYNATLTVVDNDGAQDSIVRSITVEKAPEFQKAFLFGRFKNMSTAGDYITIEAVNLRMVLFKPFQYLHYIAEEKIMFSNQFHGIMTNHFLIGMFNIIE